MSNVAEADTDLVLTPTVRKVLRRSLFWVGIAVILLITALVLAAVRGGVNPGGDPLSPTNAKPEGSKALAEVLRHEGVDVVATSTLDATLDAIDEPSSTTVVFYDPNLILSGDDVSKLVGAVDTLVLIDPEFDVLDEIAPSVAQAGFVQGPSDADCSNPAARKAGTITVDGSGYRVLDDASATTCFLVDDDIYSLVQVSNGDTTVVITGATTALSNGGILEEGNAALALNLLGANEHLVWYLPTWDDVEVAPQTAADLSPAWVFPVALVLLLTVIAAAFWRGRRFGPLIIENLPAVVRASETMRGRARLYQHSSARLHTLDSLRIGTIDRLGAACGLPRVATVEQVIASVAEVTGMDPRDIRRILLDAEPSTDRELIALSDSLLTLEQFVARKRKPE